ncbi:MAG: NAD(P)-dependent alcohol dehydrogenase [Planctomycetota bacterium]|jgi:NADPH:quinone reductase-like Zn-dependent oxidoreductase
MQAVELDGFGTEVAVRDVPAPAAGGDRARVEVHASSVNPIDWKIRRGDLRSHTGSTFPLRLGYDFSGVAGGEAIYGMLPLKTPGAFAEQILVPADVLAPKPATVSHEQAAAMPLAGLTALQALRGLAEGQRCLVIGASGGVGSYAVQIARARGAHVTGVCSGSNVGLVADLGADEVIDYETQEVFGRRYDLILDAVAAHGFAAARRALHARGAYVSTLPRPGLLVWMALTRILPGKRARFVLVEPVAEDLAQLARLADKGKLRSVIDSTYPLAETEAALRRSETGRARGKIVIKVV